jgi:Protein of unknown function (DUF3085)
MTDLIFRPEEVAPLVHHSMNAPEQGKAWGRPPFAEPMLCFVKDEGIYLMSNGEPRQLKQLLGPVGARKDWGQVAYALGYSPEVEECWDRCTEAVGGDDFVEYLPASAFEPALGVPGALIHITLTETQLTVRYSVHPKPATKKGGRHAKTATV